MQICDDSVDKVVTLERLRAAFSQFEGDFDQVVPLYSANKVHGRRMSDLAREGNPPTPRSKRIHIDSIEIQSFSPSLFPEVTIRVRCRSGTYIRSLCRDVAASMGVRGVVTSLIRTECNGISMDSSHSLYDICVDSMIGWKCNRERTVFWMIWT